MSDLPFHPLANIFPLMEGEAFAEMVEDVRTHGVREPITLFDGQILDGRNRYRAAMEAGVEAVTCDYTGSDPVAFVVSANLHRRHLTETQRALAAERLANLKPGRPENSADLQGISVADAAKRLEVSERSVHHARTVRDKAAPNVVAAVEAGQVAVSTAATVAKVVPKEEQETWEDPAKTVRQLEREARKAAKKMAMNGREYPSPARAVEEAQRTGCLVQATDGRYYGHTTDESQQHYQDSNQLWSLIWGLSEVDIPLERAVACWPEYLSSEVSDRAERAIQWLQEFKEKWDEHS